MPADYWTGSGLLDTFTPGVDETILKRDVADMFNRLDADKNGQIEKAELMKVTALTSSQRTTERFDRVVDCRSALSNGVTLLTTAHTARRGSRRSTITWLTFFSPKLIPTTTGLSRLTSSGKSFRRRWVSKAPPLTGKMLLR